MLEAMAVVGTLATAWSLVMYVAAMIGAAVIASAKGRSAFGYFLLAFFLPFIGLIIAAGMPVAPSRQLVTT